MNRKLQEAIRHHGAGDLREAERGYLRVLASSPGDPSAMHFLGVLRHQQGRSDIAADLVRRALERAPAYVDAWSNLGNIHKETGRLDEAEAAYRRALALDARHAAAWNNLGVVLRARGEPSQAVDALRQAIAVAPYHADAHYNLGNALRECRRLPEAVAAYREALSHDPRHSRAHFRLGYAHYAAGDRGAAEAVFRHWREVEPGNPIPAHMLAAFTGEHVPERASDDYLRVTFDGFAASFDDVLLHRLGYRAPQLVLAALAGALGEPRPARDILDAGCGTGLCGPLLRPYARTLTGVDLSAGMLERAKARDAYDRLHEDEITRFLAASPDAFDVIASADTLCYFGDLGAVARAAHGALRAGGWFAFTVERADDVAPYRIQPHGRYVHARAYVEGELASAGFGSIDASPAVLRSEAGAPVEGWVVRARKWKGAAAAGEAVPL